MNNLKLCQQGFFAGEFVITNEQCSFSIGDYIELYLKEAPYVTGETFLDLNGKKIHIIAFHLVITQYCYDTEIEVIMKKPVGISLRHWAECLEVGKISVVIPFKYEFSKYIWYIPKIDGWIPGMFGKVKAPQRLNYELKEKES